ncbi:hypothetical protein V8F06_014093 [Rhypophila decipiens]
MRPFSFLLVSISVALAAAAPTTSTMNMTPRQEQTPADQPQDCFCDEKQCLVGPICCRNGSCPPGTRYLRVPVKE